MSDSIRRNDFVDQLGWRLTALAHELQGADTRFDGESRSKLASQSSLFGGLDDMVDELEKDGGAATAHGSDDMHLRFLNFIASPESSEQGCYELSVLVAGRFPEAVGADAFAYPRGRIGHDAYDVSGIRKGCLKRFERASGQNGNDEAVLGDLAFVTRNRLQMLGFESEDDGLSSFEQFDSRGCETDAGILGKRLSSRSRSGNAEQFVGAQDLFLEQSNHDGSGEIAGSYESGDHGCAGVLASS